MQPVTLHGQHRPYSDPAEMELFLTFREPQRVRYTSSCGEVVHDEVIEVKYEFTSVEASMRFQSDLRRQDLVDYFDVDVAFSDTHGRTDSLTGAVRGLATIQRIKLWRDRFSAYHCLTFYSNRPASRRDRRYREYSVTDFQRELRTRDDKHRECRVGAIGRRGSAPNAVRARSFSFSSPSSWGRNNRQKSVERALDSTPSSMGVLPLDIRWLALRFSREAGESMLHNRAIYTKPIVSGTNKEADYQRFMERWAACHAADGELRTMPFSQPHVELPSPAIQPREIFELEGTHTTSRSLPTVLEPLGEAIQ